MKPHLVCLLSIGALLAASASISYGQQAWQFDFQNGSPCKLTWPTDPGRTYSLRQSGDLVIWTNAPGFPKEATGESLSYEFVPTSKGFFQVSTVQTAGGWQSMQVPALPVGETFDFNAICGLDALHLWVSGSVRPAGEACVLRSGDGGSAWSLIYRAAGIGGFWELQMATPEIGYAAGGGVRRTVDGGTNWAVEQGNLPDPPGTWHGVGPEGWVYGLSVVDTGRVWTAGYDGASAGVIYHREPGREQTDPVNINTPWWMEWAQERTGMYGVSAVNASTAWAVGFAGNIWMTTDGRNWRQQTSPTTVALQDVFAVDASTAWAVGDAGTILKTIDGGKTWALQVSGTSETLRRICAVNPNVAWAVGGGGVILYTSNGGATWIRQFSGTTVTLQAVTAVNTNTAWVAGEANTLLKTMDGGWGSWPAPGITGVSPRVAGVQSFPQIAVTVSGTGFRGGHLTAAFGDTPAESVTWIDQSTVRVIAPWKTPGTYDLTIINEDGQQATLPRAVTFLPYPILTRYSPWHGAATGGYQIEVTGFNLQSVTAATFYASDREPEALPVTTVESTRVVLTVPHSATRLSGAVTLVLDTAQNQQVGASDFLLEPENGPALVITSITPASGIAHTVVTIAGSGFSPDSKLELCGQNLLITSRTSSEIVSKVTGSAWGVGRLLLDNSESDYISIDPAFLLLAGPSPTVTQIAPATGSTNGGTMVTITGTGFSGTDEVTLDGYPVNVLSRSPTSMTAMIPPHAPGTVSLFVLSEGLERGAVVLPAAFVYK